MNVKSFSYFICVNSFLAHAKDLFNCIFGQLCSARKATSRCSIIVICFICSKVKMARVYAFFIITFMAYTIRFFELREKQRCRYSVRTRDGISVFCISHFSIATVTDGSCPYPASRFCDPASRLQNFMQSVSRSKWHIQRIYHKENYYGSWNQRIARSFRSCSAFA